MPELPEVEIVRRQVLPLLLDRKITTVETTGDSYFFLTPPVELRRRLRGRSVAGLDRRGKYLLASMDDGSSLLLHLGMTGQLFGGDAIGSPFLNPAGILPVEALANFTPDAHTHLRLAFGDGGPPIYFRDVRKFGKVQWAPKGATFERVERLGVDALEATPIQLYAGARGRKVSAKALLLDQRVLAGIGNIYADEALFAACIHPRKRARALSRAQCASILAEVQSVLRRSIETGGASISDYVHPDGTRGQFQDERRVYARTGEPCRRCKTPIRRIFLGARSTHFCPACQGY